MTEINFAELFYSFSYKILYIFYLGNIGRYSKNLTACFCNLSSYFF